MQNLNLNPRPLAKQSSAKQKIKPIEMLIDDIQSNEFNKKGNYSDKMPAEKEKNALEKNALEKNALGQSLRGIHEAIDNNFKPDTLGQNTSRKRSKIENSAFQTKTFLENELTETIKANKTNKQLNINASSVHEKILSLIIFIILCNVLFNWLHEYNLLVRFISGSLMAFIITALLYIFLISKNYQRSDNNKTLKIPLTNKATSKAFAKIVDEDLIFSAIYHDQDAKVITDNKLRTILANEAYDNLCQKCINNSISGLSHSPEKFISMAVFADNSANSKGKIYDLYKAIRNNKVTQITLPFHHFKASQGKEKKNQEVHFYQVHIKPFRNEINHESYIIWTFKHINSNLSYLSNESIFKNFPQPIIKINNNHQLLWGNNKASEELDLFEGDDLPTKILFDGTNKLNNIIHKNSFSENCAIEYMSGEELTSKNVNFSIIEVTTFKDEIFLLIGDKRHNANNTNINYEKENFINEFPFACSIIDWNLTDTAKIINASPKFIDIFDIKDNNIDLNDFFKSQQLAKITRDLNTSGFIKTELKIAGYENIIFELSISRLKKKRGTYGSLQYLLYLQDISALRQLEKDHDQDQKLKAIGQLAGGIAHDFNNILQVLMGNTDILLRSHPIGDPSYGDLIEIQQTTQRAANLTKKLLAFSRKQTLRNNEIEITKFLSEFTRFLSRTLTEKVFLKVEHGRSLPKIFVDETQLEMVLMNLAVNSRDAMEEGYLQREKIKGKTGLKHAWGEFVIKTEFRSAEQIKKLHIKDLKTDINYLLIEIRDTGSGIDEKIKAKIFDPYFTTKKIGKGTGLGLATVYGVVGQLGGTIIIANHPLDYDERKNDKYQGAVFHLYLPECNEKEILQVNEITEININSQQDIAKISSQQNQVKNSNKTMKKEDLHGSGNILVIEDEDAVRGFVVRALKNCGYEVEEAIDATDGQEKIQDTKNAYDLILSDIIMPDMDGTSMILDNIEYLQDTKLIFMSGYAETEMQEKLEGLSKASYIQKPFPMKEIAKMIKTQLSKSK